MIDLKGVQERVRQGLGKQDASEGVGSLTTDIREGVAAGTKGLEGGGSLTTAIKGLEKGGGFGDRNPGTGEG